MLLPLCLLVYHAIKYPLCYFQDIHLIDLFVVQTYPTSQKYNLMNNCIALPIVKAYARKGTYDLYYFRLPHSLVWLSVPWACLAGLGGFSPLPSYTHAYCVPL